MRFIPKVAIRFWQREWILGNGRMESGKWWRVNLLEEFANIKTLNKIKVVLI
jgi:hypothetical protein